MPAKLDSFQKAILRSLKKQYPKMEQAELDTRSNAMAQVAYNKWRAKSVKQSFEVNKDVKNKSRRVIAENVYAVVGGTGTVGVI